MKKFTFINEMETEKIITLNNEKLYVHNSYGFIFKVEIENVKNNFMIELHIKSLNEEEQESELITVDLLNETISQVLEMEKYFIL